MVTPRKTETRHGYRASKTCSCELCSAYMRGYYASANAKSREAKRNEKLYDGDDYMMELLP